MEDKLYSSVTKLNYGLMNIQFKQLFVVTIFPECSLASGWGKMTLKQSKDIILGKGSENTMFLETCSTLQAGGNALIRKALPASARDLSPPLIILLQNKSQYMFWKYH